jgi:hypothetical protein
VLPEGIHEEAANLFRTAVAAARLAPGRLFVFRSHPILPFQQVAAAVPELRDLPPNVEVSSELSLAADLRRSRWLLYRGSSTALYGILLGLRPAYLHLPRELSIDPLERFNGVWKVNVSDAKELVEAFSKDASLSGAEREAQWRPAYDFCDQYTKVESAAALDRLSSAADGSGERTR